LKVFHFVQKIPGPIGSKPSSSWSLAGTSSNSSSSSSSLGLPKPLPHFLFPNGYLDLQSETDSLLDGEDALPEDPIDNWEDQHNLMQMMHAQTTWKGKYNFFLEIGKLGKYKIRTIILGFKSV